MTVSENQLTVSGHFENLAKIGDFINRASHEAGLDDQANYAMQLAVDEACANIIEHGYGGEGRGQIQLSYRIKDDGLQVTICDQAKTPFDPSKVPEPDIHAPLEERSTRGMGIYFIRNSVDSFEFKLGTPEGNQLVLFKRRA